VEVVKAAFARPALPAPEPPAPAKSPAPAKAPVLAKLSARAKPSPERGPRARATLPVLASPA
jgi:hypothetical protein